MRKRLVSTLFISLVFPTALFYADFCNIPSSYQDEISARTPIDLPKRLKKQMEEKRDLEQKLTAEIKENTTDNQTSIQAYEDELTALDIPIEESEEEEALPYYNPKNPHLYSCDYACHYLQEAESGTYTIRLEDHSLWSFDPSSDPIVQNWHYADTLIITPNTSLSFWGSSFDYVLTNQDRNESIKANLMLGPRPFDTYTFWVAEIDPKMNYVYIKNGNEILSVWEIAPSDHYLFQEWNRNECLVLGKNDGWIWMFSHYDYILVNVIQSHYVRARLISYPDPYISRN